MLCGSAPVLTFGLTRSLVLRRGRVAYASYLALLAREDDELLGA
jgi:hypothetical protein